MPDSIVEIRGFRAERTTSSGVKLSRAGELIAEFSEEEWTQLVASVAALGATEDSLNSAALVHKGAMTVNVDIFGEQVARIALRMATGRPNLVRATTLPHNM